MSFSMNASFSISSPLFFCNFFIDAALSSTDVDWWLYGLCLSS